MFSMAVGTEHHAFLEHLIHRSFVSVLAYQGVDFAVCRVVPVDVMEVQDCRMVLTTIGALEAGFELSPLCTGGFSPSSIGG